MAEMMENRGTLTACDIFDHKLELIKDQAQRLGIENIKVRLADGRNGDPSMAEITCGLMPWYEVEDDQISF